MSDNRYIYKHQNLIKMAKKKNDSQTKTEEPVLEKVAGKLGQITGEIIVAKDNIVDIASDGINAVKGIIQLFRKKKRSAAPKKAVKAAVKKVEKVLSKKVAPAKKAVKKAVKATVKKVEKKTASANKAIKQAVKKVARAKKAVKKAVKASVKKVENKTAPAKKAVKKVSGKK